MLHRLVQMHDRLVTKDAAHGLVSIGCDLVVLS
jgi:hypothetical protein